MSHFQFTQSRCSCWKAVSSRTQLQFRATTNSVRYGTPENNNIRLKRQVLYHPKTICPTAGHSYPNIWMVNAEQQLFTIFTYLRVYNRGYLFHECKDDGYFCGLAERVKLSKRWRCGASFLYEFI